MSCSDLNKSKKRKSNISGNMGDVLGKECGDGEKGDYPKDSCEKNVREEADGAPSNDDTPVNEKVNGINHSEAKKVTEAPNCAENLDNASATMVMQQTEKSCSCDACKDKREMAAEQLKEMRCLQSFWMELRQYIRAVYRNAMEGRTIDNEKIQDSARMTELVHKLCARDPHQLFQRLEAQVQEFVIEAKVRQLELLHRDQQTPELAKSFLTGLLEGYQKLCFAASQLSTLLYPLESEHMKKQFNLTWEMLNKHLYQSCVYTDPLVQTNLPSYVEELHNLIEGPDSPYLDLINNYIAFNEEMTLISTMWRDAETLVHAYNQEQATMKAKQRMLREDWELFRAQRKIIQQKMLNKTTCDIREIDERLLTMPGCHGPRCSNDDGVVGSYCPGCNSRRGCLCDDCAIAHLLTCGGLINSPPPPPPPPPADFPAALPVLSHKLDGELHAHISGDSIRNEPHTHIENGVVDTSSKQTQGICGCYVCKTSPMNLANTVVDTKVLQPSLTLNHATTPAGFCPDDLPPTTSSGLPPSLAAGFSVPYVGPRVKMPPKAAFGKGGALCREHSKLINAQSLQNSISTQTGVERSKMLQQPPPRMKIPPAPVKKAPPNGQAPNGTRQQPVANIPNHQGHSHQNQPDVVKCAATSTTHNRPGKMPPHSCHKNIKNGEPIKRVPSGEYEGDVAEIDESDDTCSERSTSTTASNQKDRHCDCCYCEVFGHGMQPSVAPVSRNYQEMRERLRHLLTKKKAKCKSGDTNGGPTLTPPGVENAPPATDSVKPPSPAPIPELTKQDSSDSLTQAKDPRDLEALLDFIEGNQSSKSKNAKKAAKKARQKQKKLEEKEKQTQDDEEEERLQELYEKSSEVTLTKISTLPTSPAPNSQAPPFPAFNKSAHKKNLKNEPTKVIAQESLPQMVTIKRVMEHNGCEPTVTITLKGSTPEEDKVLFTLINGQMLPSSDGTNDRRNRQDTSGMSKAAIASAALAKAAMSKPAPTPTPAPVSEPVVNNKVNNSNTNNNNSKNSKKKKDKDKGNTSNTQNTMPTNKIQHSSSKNTPVPVAVKATSTSSNNISNNNNSKKSQTPQPQKPQNTTPVSSSGPRAGGNSTSNAVNSTSKLSGANKGKSETAKTGSFNLDNLKLPPGITITKVTGPVASPLKKCLNKPVNTQTGYGNSNSMLEGATIVASPVTGNSAKLGHFTPPASNVIVVDTSKMKDEMSIKDAQDIQGNGNKKNKKKKGKNGNQDVAVNGHNGKPQPQSRPQSAVNVSNLNGKQANHSDKTSSQQTDNAMRIPASITQQRQNPQAPNTTNSLYNQPAIIKVNGSMVTIRNPAMDHALNRLTPQSSFVNGRADVYMNGDVPNTKNSKFEKKSTPLPHMNGLITKGKENSGITSRFDAALLRAKTMEYNGVSSGNVLRKEEEEEDEEKEKKYILRRPICIPPKIRQHFQDVQAGKITPRQFSQYIEEAELAAGLAQAANDSKKKKKKKKNAQGRSEDWNLESVFAPKDIDLDNGDIDDAERELEAFKRFCFNSVPPQRKEKVHLNIKDIVLKKKSSTGCS